MNPVDFLFFALAAMTLIGGFLAVELKNIFHNALFFGLSLFGVAGLFIMLGSEFLALAQILVYVGAILIAIIFAIMITPALSLKGEPRKPLKQILALLAGFGFGGLLLYLISRFAPGSWDLEISPTIEVFQMQELGKLLISKHALPFEIISLVLLITMIGALLNAREEN